MSGIPIGGSIAALLGLFVSKPTTEKSPEPVLIH